MNSKKSAFDVNKFTVSDRIKSRTEVVATPKVFLPKGKPFRIHPDREMVISHVWLAFYEKSWFLMSAELAEYGIYVPGVQMYQGDLYFGVMADGTLFWMPVTYPSHPECASWRRSLLKIIRDAREDWMFVVTEPESREYVGHRSSKSFRIAWPKDTAECLLERAFRGRIMDENHPCMSFAEYREVAAVIEE